MNFNTFINIFNKNRKNIIKIICSFLFFGVIYILLSDNLYKSSISLYPAGELSENNSILSEFSEYTETFGVSMPTKSNYYIPDIINSYSLKKEIITKKWNSTKYDKETNLIEYWEINNNSFFKKLSQKITFMFDSKYFDDNLYNLNLAIKKLDNLISVNEAYSGLIEVDVLFDEPQLSADIANYISNYVIRFVNSEQKSFALKTKLFTEKRFEMAELDLIASENKLTNYRKKHPISLDTPELQLQRLRLIREVEVNQEVFITLRNQLEIAKIEESKERLFINILDKAEPSIKKAYPKIFLLLIIFFLLGLFISVLYFMILYNVNKK